MLVHPGIHVADVGHLQQERIQAGAQHNPTEDGFMGFWGASCHDDAVNLLVLDGLLNLLLRVTRAGEHLV